MNVVLRNRSLDIGGQTYPLQSIARVGVWHHTILKKTNFKLAAGLVFFGLVLFGAGEGGIALGLIAIGVGGFIGWKSLNAKDEDVFSLRLETAGSPTDAIFSYERSAVVSLKDQIVQHMEVPQEQPMTINLGDTFVTGDQINVDGFSNAGKVVA